MKRVLVGGCFDILHIGHIRFLRAAKKAGDFLTVMLEPDEKLRLMKGKNRPIHAQEMRKEMLLSLSSVDEVVILPSLITYREYLLWVKKIKPEIIAVTQNDPKIEEKRKMAALVGAKLKVVMKRLENYSTTKILDFKTRKL